MHKLATKSYLEKIAHETALWRLPGRRIVCKLYAILLRTTGVAILALLSSVAAVSEAQSLSGGPTENAGRDRIAQASSPSPNAANDKNDNDNAAASNDSPPSENRSAQTTVEPKTSTSLLEIIFAGGWTGASIVLLLVALSMGAMALAVEHWMTIRPDVLMPRDLAAEVRGRLASGNLKAADQACQAKPSFLAFVLRAGMAEVEGGWPAVEKGLEDATAEQAARLFRKIEYLSVIGNIAPMIGLLGTVMGMIFAFQEVADTQGAARAGELAQGIYTALVTTVGGLIVAIPSLAAYAIFRNRIDQLVAEAAYAAMHAVSPLKRLRVGRSASPPAPPSPPPSPPQPPPPPPSPPPIEGRR